MKFKPASNINGSSLQGYLQASYSELVRVFGEPQVGPNDSDADKITCAWELEFDNGVVATIYDWKLDHTPMDRYHWHIGGFRKVAVETVHAVFDYYKHKSNTYKVTYKYEVTGTVEVSAGSEAEAEELAIEACINNRHNETYVDDTFVTTQVKLG